MSKPKLDIKDLSAEERLGLIEQLWDSLRDTPSEIPLTAAQREELDRRLDEIDRDTVEGIPWEEVLRQIRERSK